MKRVAVVLGAYLIARGIAEPFVIAGAAPEAYRDDWGGPSLLGVLAVHCGPGVLSAVLMAAGARRALQRRGVLVPARGAGPHAR
ncbi:hypothetical protein GCM10009801_68450 [Streptomyces albiaxialis]|uniref:Uncharacterized protein n=1 Tax=Streptomyces albiaxialis TaxID=329523 RepID=A0ABN2WRS9_9ACTN